MNQIILTTTTKESLIEELKAELLTGIEQLLVNYNRQAYTDKELLSIKEVSDLFGVTRSTVHSWMNTGILKPHKVGHRTLFKTDQVLSTLTERKAKV